MRRDVSFGLEGSGNKLGGGGEMVVELGLGGFGGLNLDETGRGNVEEMTGRGNVEEMGLGWLEKFIAGVNGVVEFGGLGVRVFGEGFVEFGLGISIHRL
jgi:hypothetical protein